MLDDYKNRILVVEDEAPQQRLVTAILGRKCGYEALIVESGNAAWDYLTTDGLTEDGKVGLVLTDFNMPGGNGDELVQRIRADDRLKNLPIIMASGRPENRDTPDLDDFIDKPYNMADLISLVQKYLPKQLQ
jgi:CheY-like chemotaxis protein